MKKLILYIPGQLCACLNGRFAVSQQSGEVVSKVLEQSGGRVDTELHEEVGQEKDSTQCDASQENITQCEPVKSYANILHLKLPLDGNLMEVMEVEDRVMVTWEHERTRSTKMFKMNPSKFQLFSLQRWDSNQVLNLQASRSISGRLVTVQFQRKQLIRRILARALLSCNHAMYRQQFDTG